MMKSKIIFGTGTLYPYGLNRIFEIAKRAGFDGVEIMMRPKAENGFLDTWDGNYLQQLSRQHQLPIVSLHPPLIDENERAQDWADVVSLATLLKVSHVICHIPRINQPQYQQWFQENCLTDNNFPFQILAENMEVNPLRGKVQAVYDTITEWQNLPAMCFDVSHSLCSDKDILLPLSELGNIKQIHLSGCKDKVCHQSIFENKSILEKALELRPAEYICLEMEPAAFRDFRDLPATAKELTVVINFVSSCLKKKSSI